jgi:hypothetical protein
MPTMKCIGQGFYYQVYDLGGDRVLKCRTGHAHRLRVLLNWYGGNIGSNFRILIEYPAYAWRALSALKRSKEVSTLNTALFGNPIFKENFEYEQDKGMLLRDYFNEHDLADNKNVFDEYLLLSKTLWEYGVADTVFNFTLNNAISRRTGKLIFVDFNELCQSKDLVAECIKSEFWARQHSLKKIKVPELKDYILDKMKKELTLLSLEQRWGVRLCSDD